MLCVGEEIFLSLLNENDDEKNTKQHTGERESENLMNIYRVSITKLSSSSPSGKIVEGNGKKRQIFYNLFNVFFNTQQT